MKTDLFQSCGHSWVSQIWWHTECRTLAAVSFRIWNSSAGISLPPLALFVVTLPTWLHTPGCLVLDEWSHHHGYLGQDLFCLVLVYSCHLFLISSASVRSLLFLSFIVPILAWNVPLVSPVFMKRSLVFPVLLFSPVSLHNLRRSSYPSLLFLVLCLHLGVSFPFSLPFLSYNICKASSEMIFLLAFLFLGDGFGQHLL